MIERMRERAEKEHKDEVRLILSRNMEYIATHSRGFDCFNAEREGGHKRVVVPRAARMPRYRFYMCTESLVASQDDPILRYVPFIHNNGEYENVFHFEGTDLAERPFDRDEEIRERMMRRAFGEYGDLKLFRLKKSLVSEEASWGELKREFPVLAGLEGHFGVSISEILAAWERMFDKKRKALYVDENAFDFYFCNICYVFDCAVHDPVHFDRSFRKHSTDEWDEQDVSKVHKLHCSSGTEATLFWSLRGHCPKCGEAEGLCREALPGFWMCTEPLLVLLHGS